MLLGIPLVLFPSSLNPSNAISQPRAFPNRRAFPQTVCGAEKGESRENCRPWYSIVQTSLLYRSPFESSE